MALTDDERERALRLVRDKLEVHAAHCAKIKDKSGRITPFIFNRAQRYVHSKLEEQKAETGKVRALVLKGRQQGISTYIGERFYHQVSTRGKSAFIVAHEDKATANLYEMVKRYQDNNPLAPSTKASNAKELIFTALDCGYKLATAGTKDVGRSNTAQLLHGCLGAGALVLMADGGVKTIEALEPGDMVRTKSGEAAPVKGISWHPDVTRKVSIAKSNIELRATDSHKFWTRNGMVALADLKAGDELGFPVREITGELTHAPFASELSVRAHGGGRTEVAGPEFVELDFNMGRMLGLYLAEGYVALQSKEPRSPSSVVFACHERELERNTEWIRCVGLYSSINTRENKGSLTRMTVTYGKQHASFIERMCGRKRDKHLPDQWWKMPREFVLGLLIGYLAGDGHCAPVRDRMITAPSIVPAIAFGMRDAAASLGFGFGGVRYREGATRNGRNEKAQYTLHITGSGVDALAPMLGWTMPARTRAGNQVKIEDGFAWLAIKSIEGEMQEMVYDIEVDHPDHDYCLAQCATSNSEFAFWSNAQSHLAGLGNTIAEMADTEIILESTGNGVGNAFHLMWQQAEAGIGEYIAIFVPWYWQDEYRTPVKPDLELSQEDCLYQQAYGLDMEQMQWRASKILGYGQGFEWLFDQEYPATAALAFQSSTVNPLLSPNYVMAAVHSKYAEMNAPLVIGCDPAGDGVNDADRTSIAFRRGRVVFRVEYHQGLDTMQIAGKLAEYWRDFAPDGLIIDKGGLGAGIFDRLIELNIPVIGINNASQANDPERYENIRAEMWWVMKEWFENQPCRIPNDAALISDLTAPQPKVSSNGRKLLEKKDDMKKRQVRSPDGGDAVALTFAVAVTYRDQFAGRGSRPGKQAATSAGY